MKTTLIDTKVKQSEWNPGRLRAVGRFHYLPNIVGRLFWHLTLTASASDNVPVANVQFQVDGTNVGAPDTISPYSFSPDTTRCRAASIASRHRGGQFVLYSRRGLDLNKPFQPAIRWRIDELSGGPDNKVMD